MNIEALKIEFIHEFFKLQSEDASEIFRFTSYNKEY